MKSYASSEIARVIPISKSNETTLSAAAVDLWLGSLQGAVVVIGNAPTALFRLLELIEIKDIRPALIIGIPVGFVGARESKEELIQNKKNIDYITLRGRRGGSAIAAAAFNAIALESKKLMNPWLTIIGIGDNGLEDCPRRINFKNQ